MHKFDHPEYDVSFELPEKPTVRQLLEYDGFELGASQPLYPRLWAAAGCVIQDWHCEPTPDTAELEEKEQIPLVNVGMSLDAAATENQLDIIKWASLAVFSWRLKLKKERLPPNS